MKMKKNLFYACAMISILISVSTLAPVVYGSTVSNVANKLNTVGENKLDNKNSLLIKIINNTLDIPLEFIENVFEYFNTFYLNKNELKDFLTKNTFSFQEEIQSLISGENDYNEVSKLLLNDFSFLNSNGRPEPRKNGNFKSFEYNYNWLDNVWHKRMGDQINYFYTQFPIQASTYYEWKNKVDDYMTEIFFNSMFLGMIAATIIAFSENILVDILGCCIIFYFLYKDATLMAYSYNCCCFFDWCQKNQPDIIVHLVDENGEDISDYNGEIKAWNDDAYKKCNNINGDETVWQKHFFTYILGEEVDICAGEESNGWYSLSNRDYVNNIYEKAPCPPGNWTVYIEDTPRWMFSAPENQIHIFNLQGDKLRRRPVIVEAQLELNSN
jgi:hypothetical protein